MSAQSASILLVDDDIDACANMADILGELGYQVDVAHEGETALEILRLRPFAMALLDLRMPGMDGLALYREIKKLRPGTVAIIVSAYVDVTAVQEALAAGAWKVLTKPVDVPRLLRLIGETLDRPLVLVVDDDEDFCANLWDLLHERGYRICLAHNAVDAANQLATASYHVVLIDMKLPDGDGLGVLRLVRTVSPQARCVILTGCRGELDPLLDCVRAEGVDAICYKPLDVSQLLNLLKTPGRLTGLKWDTP